MITIVEAGHQAPEPTSGGTDDNISDPEKSDDGDDDNGSTSQDVPMSKWHWGQRGSYPAGKLRVF